MIARTAAAWLLLVWLGMGASAGHTGSIQGRVVRVTDGDTLDVAVAHGRRLRVRLGAIDAPELDQAYGRQAGAHLRRLALRRTISVHDVRRDRHGRFVGQVWRAPVEACPSPQADCASALDLGLAQVQAGMAWHYTQYAHEQPKPARLRYAEAERRARMGRSGLWAAAHPVAPWQWRQGRGRRAPR